MGDDSSLPEPFARRLARVDIPVLTSGRGRETSPGRSLYGWAKFRLRTSSKNPHNSRTKSAECGIPHVVKAERVADPQLIRVYPIHLIACSRIDPYVYHRDGSTW